MRKGIALLTALTALTAPSFSDAGEIVTFQFSGTVSSVHDRFNEHDLPFTEGMAVRGLYSFDADTPPIVDLSFQKTYRQVSDDTLFEFWVDRWTLAESDYSITTASNGVYVVEPAGHSTITGPGRIFPSILWSFGLEGNEEYWDNSQDTLWDVPPHLVGQPMLSLRADLASPWEMKVNLESLECAPDPLVFQAGDANRDLLFDQLDIVQVLVAGKYLTNQQAVWAEGDWTNDSLFTQQDIVAALATGNYLTGPYASTTRPLHPALPVASTRGHR